MFEFFHNWREKFRALFTRHQEDEEPNGEWVPMQNGWHTTTIRTEHPFARALRQAQPPPMIRLSEPGRMISESRGEYLRSHQDGTKVLFSGGIYTKSAGLIWTGDIDLTIDIGRLHQIANQKEEALYIFRERDSVAVIDWANAVAVIEPM